nr:synphilin-1-like isoform X1 [Lytechinus pictus]
MCHHHVTMENGDVIDIDDLLGVSSPDQTSLPLEEYNLDDFLDTVLHEGDNGKSGKQYSVKPRLHATATKSKRNRSGQSGTGEGKLPQYQQDDATEVFLESLLSTIKPSGEENDVTLDINSDELRRFIAEYQVHDVNQQHEGARPTEDGASISSSASESLDSSLSGEGFGGSKIKQNKKMMRGMRLLVANLLRSKTTAMASPSLGSEDERQKDVRRQKFKDKSKRREEKCLLNQSLDGQSSQSDASLNHTPPSVLKIPSEVDSTTAAFKVARVKCTDRHEAYSGINEEADKVFRVAVEEDKSTLEQYLRSNPSLRDSRDCHGNVLLHVMCRQGKLESLQWLASGLCGHHISLENNNCFTPTAIAVKYGRLDCVEWLINETKAKDELHSQDNRWSLLHIASRYGQEPCLRWLLQFMQNTGIHLDSLDRHGNSPSHLAARHGHLMCLQTLVEFNCDITMVNGKKQTPCSLATKYNHNTCAQFLVVTETCVSLSDQVTQLRRDLREYHNEKVQLKARLDDAILCSEALVRMHPRDTTQRIEQIQQQYVDLTNLLVRRIDDMHQKTDKEGAHSRSSFTGNCHDLGDDIASCKRRANELQDSCTQLLEEEHARQGSSQEGELSRIQETLHKLQQPDELPSSIGQRSQLEDYNSEPLKDMRKRLNEVSLLRAASPSVMNVPLSDKQDSVSLSSSYTSLSSSSSSLSLMTNGLNATSKPPLQKQVSWEDQQLHRGVLNNRNGGTCHSETESSTSSIRSVEQEDLASKVKRHLNDLISGKSSSQINSKKFQSSQNNQYYAKEERDFPTPTNPSTTDGVLTAVSIGSRARASTNSSAQQLRMKQNQINQSLDALMKSALPDVINSGDAKRGQVSPSSDSKLSTSSEDLSHSWHGGSDNQSRNRPLLSRLKTSHSADFALKDTTNMKHQRHSSENSPLHMKVLSSMKSEDDKILHRPMTNSNNRSSVLSVPVFMRKLQPTGHVPGGEVSVHVDLMNHENDLETDAADDSYIPRLNSDSSLSSATSSDVVWSDIDHPDGPDAGPMYKHRAGILNRTRRTGEGNRKSRNRHIKFALDEDNCPSSPTSDTSSHRRDLSPIYESESHRQQREQNAEFHSPVDTASPCNYNPPMLGHREYRVNFYSSDDDDYEPESPPEDSPPISGSNLSHAQDRTIDEILQDPTIDGQEENDKFWYESSEEDEGSAERQSLSASIGGTAERHICYL